MNPYIDKSYVIGIKDNEAAEVLVKICVYFLNCRQNGSNGVER